MLYEFKSRATGTVVMTGQVAEQVLAIVGKAPGPQGIFTVEQMGPAIAALQAAIERERTERESDARDADHHRDDEDEADRTPSISLAQRAWPLMDMLRAARAADQAVTWGI
jgi:hypothetical protein